MLADRAPSIDGVHETRPRGQRGSSAGALGVRPYDEDLDDWLGEISDEDWSEDAAERAERRRATPAYAALPTAHPDPQGPAAVERAPSARADHAETRRQVVERRRLVAGLIALVVVGVAVVAAVVLFRGGGETPTTGATGPSATPTAPSETSPSPTQSTPYESGSTPPAGTGTPSAGTSTPSDSGTSTPDTTPSTTGATGFTLPEGTKLKRGEDADPGVVSQLQQALTSAGYDPGPVDGTYGQKTEAAVTAFQQDNGLTADGVVGPDTASALNSALSG
jgi:hypothetical protein